MIDSIPIDNIIEVCEEYKLNTYEDINSATLLDSFLNNLKILEYKVEGDPLVILGINRDLENICGFSVNFYANDNLLYHVRYYKIENRFEILFDGTVKIEV